MPTPEPQPTSTASLVGTWTFQKRSVVVWMGGTSTIEPDYTAAGYFTTTYNSDGTYVSMTSPTYGSWTSRGTYMHVGNTITSRMTSSTVPAGVEHIVKLTDHDLIVEDEHASSTNSRVVTTNEFTR